MCEVDNPDEEVGRERLVRNRKAARMGPVGNAPSGRCECIDILFPQILEDLGGSVELEKWRVERFESFVDRVDEGPLPVRRVPPNVVG